jgi:hypothetical protein
VRDAPWLTACSVHTPDPITNLNPPQFLWAPLKSFPIAPQRIFLPSKVVRTAANAHQLLEQYPRTTNQRVSDSHHQERQAYAVPRQPLNTPNKRQIGPDDSKTTASSHACPARLMAFSTNNRKTYCTLFRVNFHKIHVLPPTIHG